MVRKVFEIARAAGIPTMLDVDSVVDNLDDLPQADYVWFSNEAWMTSAATLGNVSDIQDHFGGLLGVTNGPESIWWIEKNGILGECEPNRINAINTLGAGDVFRAAFAIATCLGRSTYDAVAAACYSAGEHITNKPLTKITGVDNETV
jgi:sugar/nucleoside kinase (ribokinase family)